MSLLLDALKRAEQAKREKAVADAGAGAGPPDRSAPVAEALPLELEPLPDELARRGGETALGSAPATGQVPAEAGPREVDQGQGSTTLRFGHEEGGLPGLSGTQTGDMDLDEFARKLAESAAPRVDTATLGVADLRVGSTTAAHTMPSLKNVQAALKDFYGETTGSTPVPPPPPAPEGGDETAARPRQSGVEETGLSRKVAHNVFAAKQRPARGGRSRWGLLGASAVLLTLLLVGGYYAATSLVAVRPPSLATVRPLPAPRPEPVVPAAPAPGPSVGVAPTVPVVKPPPAAPPPAGTPPATIAQAPASVPSLAGGPAVPVAAPQPRAVPEATPAPAPASPAGRPTEEEAFRLARLAPEAARPTAAVPPVPEATKPAAAIPPAAAPPRPPSPPTRAESGRARPPAPTREAGPSDAGDAELSYDPATRTLRSSAVRVTTRAGEDPIYSRLQRAYSAYQAGSYEEARRVYREVLSRDPRNRDALLGLGAVAVALGETGQAQAVYGRVLAQDPQDRVAAAVATSIAPGAAAPQSEARLRQLLQQDPRAAYVHFALGNLYAGQRRWSEAQQAYFDALRNDSRNADYAFNLAVSLDHLGERQAALDYYRQALSLAARRPGGFSEAAVRDRIDRIESGGGAGAP